MNQATVSEVPEGESTLSKISLGSQAGGVY